MNWKKDLQDALKDGRVLLGVKSVIKSMQASKGKFAVVSTDCPERDRLKEYAKLSGISVHEFEGPSKELGATVKKPFSVSAILVR